MSHFFNAAQPGVGRVQVLGSKKLQTEEEEPLLVLTSKWILEVFGGAKWSLGVPRPGVSRLRTQTSYHLPAGPRSVTNDCRYCF